MNEVKKIWYAVTNENEESYEWDNGSFSYNEALKMLEEQGEGEIIMIEETFVNGKMINNCAIKRIEYNDIFWTRKVKI